MNERIVILKIKIAHKFFMAFSLTALMIVALMIGIMQFFTRKNLSDYVNQTMLANIDNLIADLQEEYRRHNGWDHRRFKPLLERHLPEFSDFRGYPRHKEETEQQTDRPRENRPPPPFSLFDAKKQPVAGPAISSERHTFREIIVDGKIVGWLGLRIGDEYLTPADLNFLSKQTEIFYVIGTVILILAGIVSLLLSKHLLAPIRQLANGTKALASLKFDTTIDVDSEDELGQLADDFNKMAATIRHYETMRRQWIADISHELRTPLAVLQGEIEAIQDGIREMNIETLASLHSEVVRISRLVNDLHLLALADSQNLWLKKEPIKPILVLRDTLKTFRTRLKQQNIGIISDVADCHKIVSEGDKDRLTQLFSNLIENTLLYADSPGTLTIRADHTSSELTICFEDSGPGVPEESLNRLFERLYRVEKSRSRALGGSGLGLSICKEIMERHGGTIRAENVKFGGLQIVMGFRVL
jgi:two-component system sensor histidine kinase BaeS